VSVFFTAELVSTEAADFGLQDISPATHKNPMKRDWFIRCILDPQIYALEPLDFIPHKMELIPYSRLFKGFLLILNIAYCAFLQFNQVEKYST
jgi:hypothetical protein